MRISTCAPTQKCRVPITCHCTLKKLGKKKAMRVRFGEKISRGGGMFLLSKGGGSISKGGHVSSFEKGGGALAWGVHWHGGGGVDPSPLV